MRRSSVLYGLGVAFLVITSLAYGQTSGTGEDNFDKPNAGHSTSADTIKQEGQSINLDGLNNEQMQTMRAKAEQHAFQAEVNRLMNLIINSLYKNKEIFLRELLSNASDALDKIRLVSLTDPAALEATEDLSIRIKANKQSRTIHIIDTGIGMKKSDLINNLGTIAKSGTAEFLAKMTEAQSSADVGNLIGQFGVGFYSAFLVADKVVVITKHNEDVQYVWESDSTSFTITEDPRGDQLKRGTEVILHLPAESEEFLEPETLKKVVTKYSQFMDFPIYLWSSRIDKVPAEEKSDSAESTDAANADTAKTEDASDKKTDDDIKVEEDNKPEEKLVDKVVWDWVQVNSQKPVWRRKPSEVTDDEYKGLYRALSMDSEDYLGKIHFSAEGDIAFNAVLFIPKRSQVNAFSMNYDNKDRIKMYIRRVFIGNVGDDLLPKFLSFIFGIVDSDELPLNVSRETLQQNQLLKVIRKKLIRKAIEMMNSLSKEDYAPFWKEYSAHIKLAVTEDNSNMARWSKLLRYRSSASGEELTSLEEYVSRMKKDQELIYYITGATLDEVKKSPLIEAILAKGFEILYMTDPMDEYTSQALTEFQKKKLQNVGKDGLNLPQSEAAKARKEAEAKEFEGLLNWLKAELKDVVDKAVLSERLSNSPCALVATKYGWTGNAQRIMSAQASFVNNDPTTNFYKTQKKILEVNQRHPLIKELNRRIKADASDPDAKEIAELLFGMASLRSGYDLPDSISFTNKIERVMRKTLSVDEFEKADEVPVDVEPTDENTKSDEETDEVQKTKESETEVPSDTGASQDEGDAKTSAKDEL